MGIRIDWARPGERIEIQQYLHTNMGKLPYERWRNILTGRWNTKNRHYGITVRQGMTLKGFLGIVLADRIIRGKPARTGNITSWYLDQDLRRGGLGQEMVEFITSEPGVTYIATSANIRSGTLLEKIGWEVFEDRRLIWHRPGSVPPGSGEVISGDNEVAPFLNEDEMRMLNDHAGLNLRPHIVLNNPTGRCLVITYEKYKGEGVAHHEVLHCGDPEILSRNVRSFAQAILQPEKSLLSIESRFLSPGTVADEEAPLAIKRYFKPHGLVAADIDFLYGEVVLLDLKLF